jgi:addiction module HigA family antidote
MLPKRREPTHPGEILFEEFLKPLNLTSKQFADKLGKKFNEQMINRLIKGEDALSGTMVETFAAALGTSEEFWLRLKDICQRWELIQRQHERGALKSWKEAQ